MRFRTVLLSLFALIAFAVPANAQNVDEAKRYIDDLGRQSLSIIRGPGAEADKLRQLETLFAGEVDIEWVSKFVLGKHWRTATPEQQARYTENYRDFVIKHYTSKFTEYTSETFQVTNGRDDGNGQSTLNMKIVRPGKEDVLVDYRVRRSEDGKLRIFDIIVEGVSLITTQRSEFSSVVSRQGMDYLIDQLARKTAETDAKTQAALRGK